MLKALDLMPMHSRQQYFVPVSPLAQRRTFYLIERLLSNWSARHAFFSFVDFHLERVKFLSKGNIFSVKWMTFKSGLCQMRVDAGNLWLMTWLFSSSPSSSFHQHWWKKSIQISTTRFIYLQKIKINRVNFFFFQTSKLPSPSNRTGFECNYVMHYLLAVVQVKEIWFSVRPSAALPKLLHFCSNQMENNWCVPLQLEEAAHLVSMLCDVSPHWNLLTQTHLDFFFRKVLYLSLWDKFLRGNQLPEGHNWPSIT